MNRRYLFFEVLLITILLAATVACGGGSKSGLVSGLGFTAGSSSSQDGLVEDGFTLVPRGGLIKESFSLSVEDRGSGELKVDVAANNARNLPYALFELKYDASRYTPVTVDFGNFFGSEEVITAGITTKAGNVGLGIVPVHYDKKPGVSGSGALMSVTFENQPFRTVSVAGPPGTYAPLIPRESNVVLTGVDVAGNPTGVATNVVALRWNEMLVGDGDYSGEVGISDITPIALKYLDTTAVTQTSTVIDYDANGEVGISDLTTLALNYLNTIKGYNVYSSPNVDLSVPVLDGNIDRPFPMPVLTDPAYGPLGYYTYNYTIVTAPPPATTWYYYVIPYAQVGATEGPIDPLLNPPTTVTGGGGFQPSRLVGFTIEINNGLLANPYERHIDKLNDVYDETGTVTTAALPFIANENYTFDLVSADVEVFDIPTQQYLAAVTYLAGDVDPNHWDPAWATGITWTVTGTTDFPLTVGTGTPTDGTCGPDDPYSFTFTANINGVGGKTLDLPVDVGVDPNAPTPLGVLPGTIDYVDFQGTAVRVFFNSNEGAGGTNAYSFSLIAAADKWDPLGTGIWPNPQDFVLTEGIDALSLTPGQFFIENFDNPMFLTSQVATIKVPSDINFGWGVWRFRTGNTLGHLSSIKHPPDPSVGLTDLVLNTTNNLATPFDVRLYPIQVDASAVTRIVIYPDNPRVQKYPMVLNSAQDPNRFNHWIRTDKTEDVPAQNNNAFFPYVPFGPADPTPPAPTVRVYSSDVWSTGSFVHDQATWVGTTLTTDAVGGVIWLTDWGVREWNRVVIDTTQLPADGQYWIAVFASGSPTPVARGTFTRVPIAPPPAGNPEVVGIADADIAFDNGRDGNQDSHWPVLEYPTANGVILDYAVAQDPAIFVIARNLRPDVEFDPLYHDNAIRLYNAGMNPVVRIIGDTPTNWQNVPGGCSTFKPYLFGTNPGGYIPPVPPNIGDPPVTWDDNDDGWMMFPLAEVNPIFLDNGNWYVGVETYENPAWNSSAPFPIPFSIQNFV